MRLQYGIIASNIVREWFKKNMILILFIVIQNFTLRDNIKLARNHKVE